MKSLERPDLFALTPRPPPPPPPPHNPCCRVTWRLEVSHNKLSESANQANLEEDRRLWTKCAGQRDDQVPPHAGIPRSSKLIRKHHVNVTLMFLAEALCGAWRRLTCEN